MPFFSEIDDLYGSLSVIIKQYAQIKEPITPNILNLFRNELESFKKKAYEIEIRLEKFKDYNFFLSEDYKKSYENSLHEYTNKKSNDIEAYKNDINTKIENLTNDIKKLQTNNANNTKEHLLEIEWYKVSNEQKYESIENDTNNSISRLLYQLETSKNSYREYVAERNDNYKYKKENELKTYQKNKNQYQAESEKLNGLIIQRINESKRKLDEMNEAFNEEKYQQTRFKSNNTIEINTEVRKLVDEKNQLVLGERFSYNKFQNINKYELEIEKRKILEQAQIASKKYMAEIGSLEIENNKIKKEFQEEKEKTLKKYEYLIIKNTKDEENELKLLLSSSDKSQISKIKKDYKNKNDLKRKELKKEIKNIESLYKKKLITNEFKRTELDINRNYDIIINNTKESMENKYYQELTNIDENDFKFKYKYYANDYTIKSNELKLDNNLKMLKIEADYDKTNNLHQIDIEKLSSDVKKVNIEYESVKNIVDKVKDLEEKRHNKNIQYIAIINMLEIEKAKLLCEYNQNNFDLNVLDINNSLKFSKDKIDLQNELKDKENHVIIEIENKECQKAISENYNIINWLKKDLDIKIKKIEQEYNYNIENSLNELLYKEFNLESKTIIQLLSSFDLILNEIDHTIRTFISIIFNNVIVRPEHLSTINELLSSMYLQIENFYEHSLQSLNEDIKTLIKERNEIESEYKFKTNYNQIASDYLDTYNELLLKIDSIDNAIKILNIHIDRNNQARFSVKNQISKTKYTKKNKASKDSLYNSLYKYDNELIILNNKLNTKLKEKDETTKKLETIKNEKSKNEFEAKKLQEENLGLYLDLQKKFENVMLSYKKMKPNILNSSQSNYEDIENYMSQISNTVTSFNKELMAKFYDYYNEFVTNSIITHNKTKESTTSFYDRISSKIEKEYTSAKIDTKEKNSIERKKYNNEINNLNNKHQNIIKENEEKIKLLNKIRKDQFEEQYKIKDKIEIKFHNEFYALESNQAQIEKDYIDTINNYNIESKNYKKEILENKDEQYKIIDNNLIRYNYDKNIYIKNIHKNLKEDEKELIKSNKESAIYMKKQGILDRIKFFKQRTDLFKNIDSINASYSLKIDLINAERNRKLAKEKRRFNYRIKKISLQE